MARRLKGKQFAKHLKLSGSLSFNSLFELEETSLEISDISDFMAFNFFSLTLLKISLTICVMMFLC